MDMYMIDDTIDELENSDTNFANCDKLAMLYIIKDHYKKYPPVLRGLYDEVEEELNDIAPQYKRYCDIKRKYQLKEISKEPVIESMKLLSEEIEQFIKILYSSTDMTEERQILSSTLNKLAIKYRQ